MADDFLTTLYLATTAPVLIAPAMNVNMWSIRPPRLILKSSASAACASSSLVPASLPAAWLARPHG